MDPKLASYGVENPLYAVIQLAQTTMRSELGKITLDKTFEERDTLNEKIVVSFLVFYFQKIVLCFSFINIVWLFVLSIHDYLKLNNELILVV